jgi:drug/metabolite transporter (DMT)-like permease
MVANTGQGPVLLMKKLGGMFALVLGAVLTAAGYAAESTETTIVGVVLLVVGAILLALKIVRRNQGKQLG